MMASAALSRLLVTMSCCLALRPMQPARQPTRATHFRPMLRAATRLRALALEDQLLEGATPLDAVGVAAAAAAVRDAGVARIAEPVLDRDDAAALRARILSELAARDGAWSREDRRMVPGTRLRFEEVVEIAFDDGTRSDVLLPLEDDLVKAAVAKAAALLAPAWEGAAECLPGDGDGLELIECAALIAWPGSQHQTLHADFLRIDEMDDLDDDDDEEGFVDDDAGNEMDDLDDDDEEGFVDDDAGNEMDELDDELDDFVDDDAGNDLPPRLVTFIYLQDCPTVAHGPTAFLPGSANGEAHLMNEFDEALLVDEFAPARVATVDAGAAVIYDASVLHHATANSVSDNDRVVFYCSFARRGAAAAAYAAPETAPPGMAEVAPIPLERLLPGR